ncbi:hypothetical protein C3L33_09749, partial [Rhododendron williamsianum]
MGKRGVWIKLPIALVNLVEIAVQEGFRYHHAEPDYLMLVYWIPETANTLPANATHRVVVGAIVMNDKREEKSGKFRGTGVWKIPTGTVDEGEDLFAAAVREVKEETGIDVEFVEILAFRQSHKSFFDKSDLFFICMMRPLSFDIQKQESEIEAAQVYQQLQSPCPRNIIACSCSHLSPPYCDERRIEKCMDLALVNDEESDERRIENGPRSSE